MSRDARAGGAEAVGDDAAAGGAEAVRGAVVAGRGALHIGLGKVAFMVLGFAQRWLLARVVAPEALGAFALVNNAVSTLNNTVVQGTVQAVSKYTAESDARVAPVQRAGVRLQLVLAPLLALAFALGAPGFARLARAPDYYLPWFRLAGLVPLFYGFYAVFIGSANGRRRFATQAGFDAGFAALKTVLLVGGAAGLVTLTGDPMQAVTGALAGFAVAAAVIAAVAARRLRVRGPAAPVSFPVRTLALYLGGLIAYGVLVNLTLNYDLFWLRRFAGVAGIAARQADALAGQYEAARTVALLPYQALIVVTFVLFPLVSRATFESDRDATRAYVGQALRVSALAAGGMGLALGTRPGLVLALLYPPAYQDGRAALAILVAGQCLLALTSVACAMINAAGRPRAAILTMCVAVAVGSLAALGLVGRARPGPELLAAQATATSAGMAAGLVVALLALRRVSGAALPVRSVVRQGAALGLAIGAGRVIPGDAGLPALGGIALVLALYLGLLLAFGEIGPRERAVLARVLGRGRRN